jgi:hypothetical protein
MCELEGMQFDSQKFGFHFIHAWKLWIKDRPIEMIDELIEIKER